MSAPRRPKRDTSTRSDEVCSVDAPEHRKHGSCLLLL